MISRIASIVPGTTDAYTEFTQDMRDVLASLQLPAPVREVSETSALDAQAFLVAAQDQDALQATLARLTPDQLSRTILYGQSGLDRDTLLHFPVAGVVPDRTIAEARRIQRVPGYQPTPLMLVGQGLYGLKTCFDPEFFEDKPLQILDGPYGLFVLKDDAQKFDLALTLRQFIDRMLSARLLA